MGNTSDEAYHELAGWGAISPFCCVSPSGDTTKRYQTLRADSSVALFVPAAYVQYTLIAEVEDGGCTDNFEVLVNGFGPIYSYTGRHLNNQVVAHQIPIGASLVTSRKPIITFRNKATDSCGRAAVYNVQLVPDFKQRDTSWGGDRLASNPACPTLASSGCSVTSVADVLAYYGTPQLTEGYGFVNPGNLNRWLAAHSGYDGCGIYWGVADNSTGGYVAEDDPFILRSGHTLTERKQAIDNALSRGQLPIVKVNNKWGGTHWIVLSGKSGDSYAIVDPDGQSGGKLSDTYGAFYDVVIYKRGAATKSWSIQGHSPIQLLITDPNGIQTGYDASTGAIFENIPSSSYGIETGIGDDDGVLPPLPDRVYFEQSDPLGGTYSIEVIGVGDGPYELVVSNVSESGGTTEETMTGTANPGSHDTFEVHVGGSAPVGGVAEYPQPSPSPASSHGDSPPSALTLAGLIAGGGLVLAAGAGYVGGRWRAG